MNLIGWVEAEALVAGAPAASGSPPKSTTRRWDPRLYQIATLGGLLVYGIWWLDLEVQQANVVALIATALATQFACERLAGRARFDPRSALISGLSLCLLLRTGSLDVAVLAAVIAIASKFTLRVRGKHVFNPTNFALVALMLAGRDMWVSPGQWGSGLVFAFLLASAGALVVNRAARADVTLVFLACYAGLLVGRSLWLGEPRATPDSQHGRVVFAVLVALGAYAVQFWLFQTNGLLWSLAACSLAVPLIDWLLPGARCHWRLAPPPRLAEPPRPEERKLV